MFSLKLRQLFSQGSSFKIKVGAESELRRYLRRNKTQRQLSWQRKMKLEWVMVFFAALLSFNIVYNSYPETWFSQNLFMHTPSSLVMLAKA
jgi:hypothetical protein